jgi:S-methylmethionine-dependent homocysteine/selenocysteine methylase
MTPDSTLPEPGITILDGGLSTQLEAMGHAISGSLWTGRALLDQPGAIEEAHRAFVDAGADVLITASYQVSRQGFVEAGLSAADADKCLVRSIAVARRAAGSRALVAASVGPYGAILGDNAEYRGNYGVGIAELREFHRPRVEVMATAEPDWFAVETIPDVREVEALVDVLADHPDIPVWVSFTARSGSQVCAGQSIEEAVAVAAAIPSVQRVGVNCTNPDFVPELIDRMRSATDLPIIVYPNTAGAWDPETGTHRMVSPDVSARSAREWVDRGATWVGGCCGTTASRIAVIRAALIGPDSRQLTASHSASSHPAA